MTNPLKILQILSPKDLRNLVLGLVIVFSGLALAILTLWASRIGNPQLAGIIAAISLLFVLLILIFVIPPLARSASAEASQMDLPFEFTTGGAVFLGLLIIVGFAAWNTGNNLLFLVFSFLCSALLVGFLVGYICLKKLDIRMRFPETIFAGEATSLVVSLHNAKRLFPSLSIVAEVRGKEREQSQLLDEVKKIVPARLAERLVRPPIIKHTLDYFPYVAHRNAAENRTRHVFENRGRFIIRDFELSTRFPFGFFRHRRRLSAQEAEIVIFPKIESIEVELLKQVFEAGKLSSSKRGSGQDLLTLRDYQPQDDLRHIDWKATAKSRHLVVREFAAEDEKRVTIVFDNTLKSRDDLKSLREKLEEEQKNLPKSGMAKRFDKGVSYAASLLAYFTDDQSEIRLIIGDEAGQFGIGKTHLNESLKRLALVDPVFRGDSETDTRNFDLDKFVSGRKNSYTFFVTSRKEDKLPPELLRTAKVVRF